MHYKAFKILFIILLALSLFGCDKNETLDIKDTVILFANDLHCTDDDGLSYAKIAQYKADQEAYYGEDNVTLVDAGDAIQGGLLGSLSKGKYIVDIMNEVGYDIAVPGNHEFDYGVDNFMKLAEETSDFTYLASNFTDINGDDLLDSYKIVEYGDRKIAYIGIITPHTLTSVDPKHFKDDEGNYLYSFYGEESDIFYERIQAKIDEVKDEVDYIIAVAHLGMDDEDEYSSNALLANTSGIDILIDGHTHEVYDTTLKDKDGQDIKVLQTGTKGEYIGKILIDSQGDITTELIPMDTIIADDRYREVEAFLVNINEEVSDLTNTIIGHSGFDLVVNYPERIIRSKETNLGDFIADAYREVLDADIAIVNGGGIREDILRGDITYGDIISVHPFNNLLCTAEVTGQMIIDCLEVGVKDLPDDQNGGFMQISGIRYTVDTSIPSSVTLDEKGNFISVDGEYRIREVLVLDKDTGDYIPIDPEGIYLLAATNYTVKNGGDGMTMFKDAKIILDEIMVDNEVIINYIQSFEDGEIPESYSDPLGERRIIIY